MITNANQDISGQGSGSSAIPSHGISWRAALAVWCKVAALSFGGPTGQIAMMHRILVDEKRWISDSRFLHALNYCMLLPGPEAQQLATYIGWLLHGTRGGLVAGVLFILPGAAAILALSMLYVEFYDTGFVQALFYGLKPAVVAVVVEAVLRIGKRVLKNGAMVLLAAAAFGALFFFGVSFPIVIAAAGVIGWLGGRWREDVFYVLKPKQPEAGKDSPPAEYAITDDVARAPHTQTSGWKTLRVAGIWLLLWLGPLGILAWRLGTEHVLVKEGVFFSKAAVVTFGGAYSVLGYVKQEAVEKQEWLSAGEMLDGLGMAETTPGPLIMVVQFVGFLGAYRDPGALPPLVSGLLGSLVTTWGTFAPCFLWIFTGAPYIEKLRGNKTLSTALSAITAAVVGVVLNLAVWFAWQTLIVRPANTLDLAAVVLCLAASLAILRFHVNMLVTLGTSAVLGATYYMLFMT
ncbi:MAG: chromate efflux transporter [Planctomycetales bacterium]